MPAPPENKAHAADNRDLSGSGVVRVGFGLDEAALRRWMQANVAGFAGDLHIEQFKGGQSNPTYKLVTPGCAYVLRRKPAGAVLSGAHAVDREARVMSALTPAGIPTPRVYALCTDDTVIGAWFYVMEMVEGRNFWDPAFPGVTGNHRRACFESMVEVLAALHQVDAASVGLADYGRPGNYFVRQISRWSKQYLADADAGRHVDMDWLIDWLSEHVPASEETSIVHGDFRCDNLIFHPNEPRVIAVLDWELSTLGHPLADFGYSAMMYHRTPEIGGDLVGRDLAMLNIPIEEEYVAAYCERTGRSGIPDWNFYLVFNFFRLAAILHGVLGRHIRGTSSSEHAKHRGGLFPVAAGIGRKLAARC